MTQTQPRVSVLIGTRDRVEMLARCVESVLRQDYLDIEVLVLDDCSETVDVCSALSSMFSDPRLRCYRSEQQRGVAGGRNDLARKARGEFLVVLDDDAWFADDHAITQVVQTFDQHPEAAVLAFRVVLHRDQHVGHQLPFSRRALRKYPGLADAPRTCAYYIGAGHALRRTVFLELGGYPDGFMYYGEEVDLAYRVIQRGYVLWYVPSVVVHHRPARSVVDGGGPRGGELYYSVRNRIWLAYRFLPVPIMLVHLVVWLGYFAVVALRVRSPGPYLKGLRDGFRSLRHIQRRPLQGPALAYLKQNFGRLWY